MKGLVDFEGLLARDKIAHLNHFQIEHVIHEAKKQVYLANEQEDQPSTPLLHLVLQNVLEDHQARAQRRAELVRKRHLANREHVVVLLLLEQLGAEGQGLELVREVVEIDSCSILLQEVCALHSDLRVVLNALTVGRWAHGFQLVDAVALIRLILLRQDNLLQTHRCFLGSSDERLVEACDVSIRETNRPESTLVQ